jgi:hypothetical protein
LNNHLRCSCSLRRFRPAVSLSQSLFPLVTSTAPLLSRVKVYTIGNECGIFAVWRVSAQGFSPFSRCDNGLVDSVGVRNVHHERHEAATELSLQTIGVRLVAYRTEHAKSLWN